MKKVVIGAGTQRYDDWEVTQGTELNLLRRSDFERHFSDEKADILLCEHVWEHLTRDEGLIAAKLCCEFLKPGGYLRCAVPDGFFWHGDYINTVKVGGPGPSDHPAADHKVLYDYRTFSALFQAAGFHVELLEYIDERGLFRYRPWDSSVQAGFIYRSLLNDPRNKNGVIQFTSIIVDAKKPLL